MSLYVSDYKWNDLKGKELVGYNFNPGNEYVLLVRDPKTEEEKRVRIPAVFADMLEQFQGF